MERDLSNGRNDSRRTSQTESTANRTAGPRRERGRSYLLRPRAIVRVHETLHQRTLLTRQAKQRSDEPCQP